MQKKTTPTMTAGVETQEKKILHVRTDDKVTRAVVAEQRAAHAVVHVADRAATDGDEVEDERTRRVIELCEPHF